MCDCKMLDLQNLHPLKFVHYTVWLVNLRGSNFCGLHGCLLSMKRKHDDITAQGIKIT